MIDASKKTANVALSKQIKVWVRDYAMVPEDFAILVTELKCAEPGCPPLETIVALLGPGGAQYQQKVHLAINQITEAEAQRLSKSLQAQMTGVEIKEEHAHE